MATPTPIFPDAIATVEHFKRANNLVESRLRVSVTSGNLVLFVDSVAGFKPDMLVSIDQEIIAIEDVATSPDPALIVATDGRGFDGTSAASHAAGARVKVLIDAWHHNSLSTEVQAIQEFLGPNGRNISSSLSGMYLASAFAFSLQPGGSLVAGVNVITLPDVPLGINGNDTEHWVRISGGTGAAETCKISGGTAVSGGTGTIVITCVNSHSGAWKIESASGGIVEAGTHLVKSGQSGTIVVDSPIQVYQKIQLPNTGSQVSITIQGHGSGGSDIVNDQTNQNRDIFYFTSAQPWPSITLRDLEILAAPFDGVWTNVAGAAVHFYNYGFVPAVVENVRIHNGYRNVWIEGSQQITLEGGQYGWHGQVLDAATPRAGVEVSRTVEAMPSNIVIRGIRVQGIYSATRPNALAGILISSSDGTMISDVLVGQVKWGILLTQNTFFVNVANCIFDYSEIPASLDATTGILFGPIVMANNWFGAVAASAVPGPTPAMQGAIDIKATSPEAGATAKFALTGNIIMGGGLYGILVLGGKFIGSTISGNVILGNNSRNQPGGAGIALGQGASHIAITGNAIRDAGPASGFQNYGIVIADPGSTDLNITGNTLAGNLIGPILAPNPPTGSVIGNNTGLDDVAASVVAANSTAFPPNPNFLITGTTPINGVGGVWEGRRGTFRTPDGVVNFTAGATIGNTFATVANVPVLYWVQGGKIWLK